MATAKAKWGIPGGRGILPEAFSKETRERIEQAVGPQPEEFFEELIWITAEFKTVCKIRTEQPTELNVLAALDELGLKVEELRDKLAPDADGLKGLDYRTRQ